MSGISGKIGSGANVGFIKVIPIANAMKIQGRNRVQNKDFQSLKV
jgi:hypothetical protein